MEYINAKLDFILNRNIFSDLNINFIKILCFMKTLTHIYDRTFFFMQPEAGKMI